MVGGCGVVGGGAHSIDGMAESLARTGEERISRYEDGHVSIRGCTHGHRPGSNPGRAPERDALVWIWGNVVGSRRDGVHRRRRPDDPAPAYCARRYDEVGLDFVRRLNGDFVGVVYDRERRTVSVFTDRLGTWPLHVTEADDGAVVFSSHLQALRHYPSLSLSFDEGYVVQHLTTRGGPYGVKTPIEGVETYPPGTITTYGLDDGSTSHERYWRPRLSADGQFPGYDAYVDAFVERFQASMADRTQDRSKRYGILLSGGSDARVVLAALDDDLPLVAYHMADWMSKEARTAERIAMAKDVDFRFLRRERDYAGRVLDRSPRIWNYQQLFNQAWAEGFIDEIRDEVDVLFTGHFADTLFKGQFVPTRYVHLGPIGSYPIPVELPVSTLEAFDRELVPPTAAFVESDVDPSTVVDRNVTRVDGGVESYGIEFDSLRDFVLGRLHRPATTDPFFRQSLRENLELQMPVYDDRLLDLWAGAPTAVHLRHNVVNDAVSAMDPELAAIPHADSGVPVGRSPIAHRVGALPMNALRRLSPFDAVPSERVSHNPWGNHRELIRTEDYLEEAIYEAEDRIRALPFLDWDAVVECYEDHVEGADNTTILYRLVTFLEAPLTKHIVDSRHRQRDGTPTGRPDRGGVQ